METVNAVVQDDVMNTITIVRKGDAAKKFDAAKVFSDYFANKGDDDKKQAAAQAEARAKQAVAEAEAKKIYDEKFGAVKAAKVAELAVVKAAGTTTASGLTFNIVQKGAGAKPADGTTVYINYAGYLEDGSLFDSCIEEVAKTYGKFDQNRATQNGYQPFPFQAGKKDGLIPGFIEGVEQMAIGDKAVIFIPSKLGYGERGAGGVIPPNANIIFEIELTDKAPLPAAK
jgi:FKBP-type peptidyl-prolyl cis-trans isomerase